MKLALSKPISSPGRQEKFPPPLMRFLRSNVGSRSRGRSRASPMFYLRSKKASASGIVETTQEPSSPKVTCIGQVRVRRSSKSKVKKRTSAATSRRRRCWWFKKSLFCGEITPKFQKRPFRRCFGKWVLFFRSGYCKKVDATEDSFRVFSSDNQKNGGNNSNCNSNGIEAEVYNRNRYESLGLVAETIKRNSLDSSYFSSSPPKNALILTRSRSAPYRSSSLGGRFRGSPLRGTDENDEAGNEEKSEETTASSCENVVEESKINEENVEAVESQKSEEKNVEDLKGIIGIAGNGGIHPLLLTRCKSEPARRGERLINQEANFRRQRRFGAVAVEPCSGHNSY